MPLGMVIEVTSLIWLAVHSRSMYRLQTVISQLSQVLDPSPQGVLRQQMRRCLLGSLTGPEILTFCVLALPTSWLVTCWTALSLFPLKVILVRLTSWSSSPSFLVSLSAMMQMSNIYGQSIYQNIKYRCLPGDTLLLLQWLINNNTAVEYKRSLKQTQTMQSQNKRRCTPNQLLLGTPMLDKFKQARVLLVGAGGIGCEVVKNISKLGLTSLTIIDFDLIEETNLNRQFYFRKKHIGQAKALVLKQQVQKIAPQLIVQTHYDSIYDKKYNDAFYSQFTLIISALDNMKAREHLAAQATRNSKPMIDAGTMSYNGQAYASIRFLTSCHNCSPTINEQPAGGVCLIRSRPERPIHCATYAKNFYLSFFGGNRNETMSDRLKPQNFLKALEQQSQDKFQQIARAVFVELFDAGITDYDFEGNKIDIVRKINLQDALQSTQPLKNPESTLKKEDQVKQTISPYRQDKLWSLKQYANQFIKSFANLLKRSREGTLPANFEKDDEDSMMLVYCITTLRTYNFINWHSPHNKHQFLSYYRCKDLIGKVMPAIASTNAIAAALEMRQMLNILGGHFGRLRLIHFSNYDSQRLSPCIQSEPNINCEYCSEKVIYAKVELDMAKTTFGQFQVFAEKQLFSFGRDLYSGSFAIIRNSRKKPSPNKHKSISFVDQLITNGVLPVSFRALLSGSPITVHISIFHKQGSAIRIFDTPSKHELRLQVLRYYRRVHEQKLCNQAEQILYQGGYEQ